MRADEGKWEPLCAGIERKVLWFDREKKRITFLIRAEPGAEFPAHHHDDDERTGGQPLSEGRRNLALRKFRYWCERLGLTEALARRRPEAASVTLDDASGLIERRS